MEWDGGGAATFFVHISHSASVEEANSGRQLTEQSSLAVQLGLPTINGNERDVQRSSSYPPFSCGAPFSPSCRSWTIRSPGRIHVRAYLLFSTWMHAFTQFFSREPSFTATTEQFRMSKATDTETVARFSSPDLVAHPIDDRSWPDGHPPALCRYSLPVRRLLSADVMYHMSLCMFTVCLCNIGSGSSG